MRRFAVLAMGMVVMSATARAEPQEQEPPRYRLFLTGGAAGRNTEQTQSMVVPLKVGGVSPTVLHAGGALFFLSWLGAALDASFETYAIMGRDLANSRDIRRQLFGFRVMGEAVGRWSPRSWIGLELHVGYAGGMWPAIALNGPNDVVPAPIGWHGPSLGFAITLEPEAAIGGQLFGRFQPAVGGNRRITPWALSSGLQVWFGNFALGGHRLAGLIEGEIIGTGGEADRGTSTESSFSQLQVRFALGLRLRQQSPPPIVDVNAPKPGMGKIRGRVVTGGIGLSGVSITSPTLPATTSGPEGDFELNDVAPGKHTMKALLEGYKPAEVVADVPAGDEAVVTLALLKPTGPGKLRGVVKSEKDAPIADAEVTAEGRAAVKTGADGAYTIDGVGPGPVKVTVKAPKGFQNAEDAAQVPPEGISTLDFTLLAAGVVQPATIRGSVRAVRGKLGRALVRISDVNLTVPIKGDGRFVVQVPGGTYTLTIEAAGFVTQVKTVEVADGDQAIFQVDLQPVGR